MLKGLSKTTTLVGKFVEKIPVVSDTQADAALLAAGDKLRRIEKDRVSMQMQQLIEQQGNYVRPFIDNIEMVNTLQNKPIKLLVDSNNIYIATA